ncbi:helix-turn-helix domain-containing protein [Nocardia vulneris]|uniref:helix-turn-helix domain-containing protein n=1 Tax=Nocardia vulneris TaxID=1141657 RepID=UPI0030D0D241
MTQTNTKNTPLDAAAVLRLLTQTMQKIIEGESVDRNWLIAQLDAVPSNDGTSQPHGPLLTVPETSDRLRISRWSVYDLIHRRQLLSVKIGRRRFIPSTELTRYLNSLPLTGGQLL